MSYSIGEAARTLNVPPSTLRYYESEGLLPELKRTDGGIRRFTKRDLEACRVIECLKMAGLSIKDIRDFMTMVVKGDETLEQRLKLFEKSHETITREIEQLEQTLAVLDFKRWYYQTAIEAGTEDAVRNLDESDIPKEHKKAKAILSGY